MSVSDGPFAERATADGATVDGATVDGATVDGATVDGASADGPFAEATTADSGLFGAADFDEHEHVSFFFEPESGLRAIVAIHSSAPLHVAGGGCRMWPYPSEAEALRDALRLSRAMSYKLALCDVPAGGGKCVVIGDPTKDKSEALLRALGRAVERLGGRFVIAEDVGTTPEDMRVIGTQTRHVFGRRLNTGPATAYGTFVALRTAVSHVFGLHRASDLRGLTVAVQGLGNVGARFCRYVRAAGGKLIVSDVRRELVERAISELGATAVSPEAIYDAEAEVFAPCALGGILDERTIARLRCKVIVGSANNPLVHDSDADRIAERRILFVPDFIANAGGVLVGSRAGAGWAIFRRRATDDESAVFPAAERIAELLTSALVRAEKDQLTPYAAAVHTAKQILMVRRRQSYASAAFSYVTGVAKARLRSAFAD